MTNLVNFLARADVTCSVSGGSVTIPGDLVNVISTIINLLKIAIPIMLIIWGMLDLGKAVMAQKEDEIKKGQQTFIKRLIAAAIVFFVVVIVQLVVSLVAGDDSTVWTCVKAIIGA